MKSTNYQIKSRVTVFTEWVIEAHTYDGNAAMKFQSPCNEAEGEILRRKYQKNYAENQEEYRQHTKAIGELMRVSEM